MTSFQKVFQLGGSFIYGRDNDIYGITKLLSSEEGTDINSAVVSVVADRGTGRTTMLHLLQNELCNDFDITKYICMPKTFDEKGIMRLIAESLTGSSCDITDLEVLKETVKEELIDQRFLLLLDDFENKSQKNWDLLLALLKICEKESAVVVTTTREAVAKVKGPIQFYYMNNLSKEWCWMIFKQSVFSGHNPDSYIELADIGKCLVAKCRNVTLCIKVLSGVVRYSIAADSWRAVLHSKLWEIDEVDGGILPALRVCYEYLPFHLKQCFKYCSLFPKEYIFSKKHLVLMWLSQGFVVPGEGRELEEIGLEHFDQLLSRSFLQAALIPDMKEDRFVMPGLIHDLAQQLSKNECFQFEGCVERAPENACHLALVPHEFQSVLLSHLITRPQNLQTILVVSRSAFKHQSVSSSILKLAKLENLFIEFHRLVTLDLSNADVEELPKSLGSLINLHYLSLSGTDIKRIPLEISNLIHLQTLEAKDCHYLGELPRTIESLTNLRYLDVTKGTGYVVMPHGIGKLTNLRSLATFNVGEDSLLHCGIKELKDLKHLKGCLEISGLVKVKSGIDAKKADVRSKENIETLCYQWSDGMSYIEGEESTEIAEEVLESLHPTESLNEIIIRNYPGKSFPTWIECAAFSRLVSVIVDNCNNCETLPALGGLPLLRFLSIQKMYCIQRMSLSGSEYISENIIRYPSLEQLNIWEMYELVEWVEIGNEHFPILQSLFINRCPSLRNVPKFPALVELSVYSCAQFLEAMDLPSLQSLRIQDLQKTRSFFLPENLVGLNKLEISHCPELLSIEGLTLLNSLETIIIFRCAQFNFQGILDERLSTYEDRGNTRFPDQSSHMGTESTMPSSMQHGYTQHRYLLASPRKESHLHMLEPAASRVVITRRKSMEAVFGRKTGLSTSPVRPKACTGWQEDQGTKSSAHPLPLPLPPGSMSRAPLQSQWKKGKLLGRGTFGHVYLGFNSENGQMCAIKEVHVISDDSNSRECLSQLNQEISLLSKLSHPNIVQYYGSELVDDALLVYLEYVSGGSIHKLLQEHGPFKEPVIRNYTAQILSGLAYLHRRNTVHRDIKGANILVDPCGDIKLADFGMAKLISSYTSVRSFRGSPYWMAPEIIMNANGCNLSVDIWSLGCTIMEMATSKPPWNQYEGVAAIFKIGNSKEIPEIPEHFSAEGKHLLNLCLQRDPAARPTAAQLMEHPFVREQAAGNRPIKPNREKAPSSSSSFQTAVQELPEIPEHLSAEGKHLLNLSLDSLPDADPSQQESILISLRQATRENPARRKSLCTSRLLAALRPMLLSQNPRIQINAAAAMVNLSLEPDNKLKIVRSDAVSPLVEVLKLGHPEARDHAAGAIYSLALEDDNRAAIGVLGAIPPLLNLFADTSADYRARREAGMALYYVSLGDMNRNKIARASGAVRSLIGLAAIRDGVAPAKAAAIRKLALMVVANLAGCTDGRAVLMDSSAIAVVAGLMCDGVVGPGSAEEEYCLYTLYRLSRGGLRFRGLARAAGVEAVLVRVADGGGEGTMRREMAKRTLRAMRGEDDEASSVAAAAGLLLGDNYEHDDGNFMSEGMMSFKRPKYYGSNTTKF